ncbi:hypothetical protein ACQR0Z_33220 [Bradyrhizobium sp. HKCCYLS3077]|uniref:hypothetical protein n=1 Tax=Bradyrhizobium sp. HKCCYLS3077 TaxID=3420761 RepID=UPI003EBE78FE
MSYVFEIALAAVLLFFLFLPITDRRTVMMKVVMMVAAIFLFAATLVIPHAVGSSALLVQASLMTGH